MKWLLLTILIGLVLGRRVRVGDLFEAVQRAPAHFKRGRLHADDPIALARDVTARDVTARDVTARDVTARHASTRDG